MNSNQIKSKNRVLKHGEVLTPSWVVNDMLDLIPDDGTKISSRYLENSCGEGAFLTEILKRKLEVVFKNYRNTKEREFYTIVALTNIYGLELLKDNVETTKERLREIIKDYFTNRCQVNINIQFLKVIDHVLDINIINMNALTYQIPLSNNNELLLDECGNILYSNELSRISEWQIDYKTKEIQRVEYYYRDIVKEQEDRFYYEKMFITTEPLQLSLFDSDLNSDLFDIDNYVRIAKPIRLFEQILYIKLINAAVVEGEANE
jgi:RNA processing factor Prp31